MQVDLDMTTILSITKSHTSLNYRSFWNTTLLECNLQNGQQPVLVPAHEVALALHGPGPTPFAMQKLLDLLHLRKSAIALNFE